MADEDFSQFSDVEGDEESFAERQTAGSVLKAERIRRELSEKSVADKLHITMHYVMSIEADCYEKLPGKVFAKGYIKSYAQLLQLNEAEVLELFEDFSQQQLESAEESRQKAIKAKDRNKPWLILSAVIFIAGFTALWLYNKYMGDEVATETTSLPASSAEPAVEIALSDSDNRGVAGVAIASTVEEIQEADVSEEEPQPLLSGLEAALANAPGFADSAAISSEVIEPAAESAAAGRPTEAVRESLITVNAGGNDKLEISFSGESWVEITDSDSNQVFRDIRAAGDVIEISGNAPFNILLGDAPFATMFLNGEAVNVADSIRIDNSARLVVGP